MKGLTCQQMSRATGPNEHVASEVLRVGFPGLGAEPAESLHPRPRLETLPPWTYLFSEVFPIREPMVGYGLFVMNYREESVQAIEDSERGRLIAIPSEANALRHFA